MDMASLQQSTSASALGKSQIAVGSRPEPGKRRRWFSGTSGNAITEFALIFPLFILMVCAITDLSRLFYAETTLQNAVRQGSRYASTGNHQPDPLHSGQTLSRIASIDLVTQQAAIGLSTSNLQISSAVGGSGSAGGPGDTVTLSLTSNVKLLTPIIAQFFNHGQFTFTVTSTNQNEYFPPSQTT